MRHRAGLGKRRFLLTVTLATSALAEATAVLPPPLQFTLQSSLHHYYLGRLQLHPPYTPKTNSKKSHPSKIPGGVLCSGLYVSGT